MRKKFLSLGVAAVLLVSCGAVIMDRVYTVPVLMYHRVEANAGGQSDTVSPEIFLWQMRYLSRHGYRVISLNNLVDTVVQGRRVPRRTVVLTFDDGYENNYTTAFPVLREQNFPATIFIAPDFMGKDGFVSWPQVQEMEQGGISFGSHGMTQAYLPDLSPADSLTEIAQSKILLDQNLKNPVLYFAYPVGGFNDGIKALVRQAGYKGALATNRGYDRFNKDVYEINRIRLSDKDKSPLILWIKLSGFYNLFRKGKSPD